jgi:hypothetical protein
LRQRQWRKDQQRNAGEERRHGETHVTITYVLVR